MDTIADPVIGNEFAKFLTHITLGQTDKIDERDRYLMMQAFYSGFAASMRVSQGTFPNDKDRREVFTWIKEEIAHFSKCNRELGAKTGLETINSAVGVINGKGGNA